MGIDWTFPVNRLHPLNDSALKAWYLNTPNVRGGTTLRDLMGQHHGTLNNMDPATAWKPQSRPGAFGALDYDGVDDGVDVGLDFNFGGSVPFTVSAWFKKSIQIPESQFPPIISRWRFFGHNRGWYINMTPDEGVAFTRAESTSEGVTDATVTVSGVWYHVIGTFSPDKMSICLNGDISSITPAPVFLETQSVATKIGQRSDAFYNFNGQIDSVRIYNRSMNDGEMRQLYILESTGYGDLLNRQQRVFAVPAVADPFTDIIQVPQFQPYDPVLESVGY